MDVLSALSGQIICQLTELPALGGNGDLINQWEEFCWHYNGNSSDLGFWEEAIMGYISINFDKLSETERSKMLLYFDYDVDDIHEAIFSLIKSASANYLLEDD